MKLTVLERMLLPGLLPTEESFLTMKLVHAFRMAIGWTEEDLSALNIEDHEDGRRTWTEIDEIEVKTGPVLEGLVATKLKAMNDEKKISPQHFSLFEKFCDPDKDTTKGE